MLTPFEILEIPENAIDDVIKKAYLKKVRAYPPEQSPEKFQQIRDAFEKIKTEKMRLSYQLFQLEKPDFVALLSLILKTEHPQKIDETLFCKCLAESLTSQS